MRKLLLLSLTFSVVLPALAQDDEARIKAAVEDRYMDWIAAANKTPRRSRTFTMRTRSSCPRREEPVIGKAAIGEYYKKLVADPHFVPFT